MIQHRHRRKLHQLSSLLVLAAFAGVFTTMTQLAGAHYAQDKLGAATTPAPATPTPTLSPSPSASPTPTPAIASAPRPRTGGAVQGASGQATGNYGIADSLAALPSAELNRRLSEFVAMGISWVRFDVEWSQVQADGPGGYHWADYDRTVQAAAAHGLRSLVIIDYTPAWARKSSCADTAMCAPANPAAYAAFAAQVAGRYKALGVHHYEIWNEPNNAQFFRPGANVGEYTALLRAAYPAIKAADPAAVVITGGTSPAGNSGGNIAPPDFIQGIYNSGGRGSFDAVAHHPYTWPFSPAFPNPHNAWGQLTTIHNIMAAAGDGGKQVWITEFGAPTGGPGGLASSGMTYAEGGADHVTEALEAKIATDAVAGSARLPWVGPFFWYSYKDDGTAQDDVENFFGLVRADGSRKPAYNAFISAIRSD